MPCRFGIELLLAHFCVDSLTQLPLGVSFGGLVVRNLPDIYIYIYPIVLEALPPRGADYFKILDIICQSVCYPYD